ncbi:type IV pilus secretin PilQ [Trinickia mobilis]|uniref:type IV pilus secretin PilQ n=1 Tax=Trinickia mobilis TaxID=2816356 RepID=UPI002867F0F6|nr:type IV pilus secretin PilQ [Trinickia mobilis]
MIVRYGSRWVFVIVCFVAAAARASVPPLPPLPAQMPLDDSVGRHRVLPLFKNGGAEIPSPLQSEATQPRSFAPLDDDVGSGDAAASTTKAPVDAPAERATDAAAAPLEGPPVPLTPPQRMSGGAANPSDIESGDNKPITLNFQNAELGAVLDAFARFTNLNIVASERVRGFVSLRLHQVPWRTAFDTLLDVNGLAMERRGNVIWVAPLADLAARERLRFEAHARAAELEPLASRTFELHYARAEDVVRLLSAPGGQRVLSKRGAAMADPRTNLMFVTDLDVRLAQIAELLAAIDKPTRQVLIEARIVEGEHGFSRDLGARLSLRATQDGGTSTGLSGGREGSIYDLSARPISGFDAATAGFTLFAARATRFLNVELSALEAEGRGEIVSSPRVVTADRMKAIVEQGTEVPYQAKVGNGVSGVQFRRASLKLEVEPQITPAGRVILDLDVAKDSVGEQTANGPAINTKHVQTRVEVEDGGTVSIGGIYESNDRDDVTRVPLLGKIPLLGALFRHRARSERRNELVVFITPHVVETQ